MKKIKKNLLILKNRIVDAFNVLFARDKHYIIISIKTKELLNFYHGNDVDVNIRYRVIPDYLFCELLKNCYENLDVDFVQIAKIKHDKLIQKLKDEN